MVIASAVSEHLDLQNSLSQQTKKHWHVSHFGGTELDLVEDIRLRATTSKLPGAALIPGATIRRWAALGFLKDLNTVSGNEQWQRKLPEQIYNNIVFQDKAFAVPTQVHRSNWM